METLTVKFVTLQFIITIVIIILISIINKYNPRLERFTDKHPAYTGISLNIIAFMITLIINIVYNLSQ